MKLIKCKLFTLEKFSTQSAEKGKWIQFIEDQMLWIDVTGNFFSWSFYVLTKLYKSKNILNTKKSVNKSEYIFKWSIPIVKAYYFVKFLLYYKLSTNCFPYLLK